MNEKNTMTSTMTGVISWAFLLCIAWFGHFNNWWPIAFPIVFTVIISAIYIIALITALIFFIIKLNE